MPFNGIIIIITSIIFIVNRRRRPIVYKCMETNCKLEFFAGDESWW